MIIIEHGKFTAEKANVHEAYEYINAEKLTDYTVKLRVRIPGSEFMPLVEAIDASGGKIL